ncbi:hypothetical protein CYMTET_54776 [Cymbomonas tetramitiformis]|uniref:Reverse transcriptase domain-containing protein n=1 Tax=Cymbomonas tetramitiformis TaxID=36881 RepID=A0AAE0EQD7_9CHLO|nr:hypothetical protein CYMTET_54776 [Cymbomonas tetramitiformis]
MGDPSSPFFLAAPLHPVLLAVLQAQPEVYVIAYLDDIHILGEPDRVRAAYDTAVPLLAEIGLELNVRKSAVFSLVGACGAFQDVVDANGDPIPGVDVKCVEMASTAGAILPKPGRLNDPPVQLLLLSCGPGGGAGLGLTSAQRLAPAGWLGSWAHVWKRMSVLFPVVRGLFPHLGAREGTYTRRHPLVAGLVSAMHDVRGARRQVLEAEASEHLVPEGLQIPEEAPSWGTFGDTQPASQKQLTICQHGLDWLRLFDAANPTVRARLLSLSRDGATWHLNASPEEGGFRLKPIAAVTSLCLQLGVTLPLVREVSAVRGGGPVRLPLPDV